MINDYIARNMARNRSRSATLVVAASNASSKSIKSADYVCDGTADDVEINAAITALGSVGGDVLLTEGQFNTAATINLASNVTLRGRGFGTVIKLANSTSINVITIDQKDGVIISDLKIDGNASNQTLGASQINQHLIYHFQSTNCIIRTVWGYNGIHAGVSNRGNTINYNALKIDNSQFTYNRYGVYLSDRAEYNIITNTNCNYNTYGFYVQSPGNTNIIGCNAVLNSQSGIHADFTVGSNPYRLTITGCHINHNSFHGIHLNGGRNVFITNAMCVGNRKHGILFDGVQGCTVIGGMVGGNSVESAGLYDEIRLASNGANYPLYNTIRDTLISSYGAQKAGYLVNENDANCNNNRIEGIRGTSGATGTVRIQGANSVSENNTFY